MNRMKDQKMMIIMALLGATKQAASPVMNSEWPLYPNVGSYAIGSDYATTKEYSYLAGGGTDLKHLGGYQCIRYGLVFSLTQNVNAGSNPTAVITDGTGALKSFYQTENDDAKLGALGLNFDCCTSNIST